MGRLADPMIQVSGTWGSGTLTVTLDGVDLLTTYTGDVEQIFDTLGSQSKITLTLSGATSPELDINVIGTPHGREVFR